MVVQHNMQAANANRMLNITTGAQSKSTEKLSSGYRINRAADDAAGLSISEKMRKQIRGLDKASSNAEDGVSSVQTAEGALTEVHSMLQRMNELATQSANGTNSTTDRKAIQDEIDQLTTEIDRVAETTKFNETYLLKGDNGTKTVNMKAHDAGLKGTLTDNGDGTATFVMDELKDGDSVSIGGKNYTIGSSKTDVETVFTNKIKQVGDSFELNGKTISIVEDAKADPTAGKYKAGDIATTVKGLITEGSTVKFGNSEYKVMKGADDGIDDVDKSVITAKKAYMLAQDELLKANQIGDTNGGAKVGKDDYAVLPIENSSAGIVSENYDLLVEYDNYIVGEQIIRIDHSLMGLPGAKISDIRTVYSHPQALMQCSDFFDEHKDINQVAVRNTAFSAKKVKDDGDITQAGIASHISADIYGLQVLESRIQNNKNNATRFIIVSAKRVCRRDADRISICFETPHKSGALYHMLAHFIYNGINMLNIQSRPISDKAWEYRFFVDFEGRFTDTAVQNALRGIREEAIALKILGTY